MLMLLGEGGSEFGRVFFFSFSFFPFFFLSFFFFVCFLFFLVWFGLRGFEG